MHRNSNKKIVISYLILIVLTLISALFAEFSHSVAVVSETVIVIIVSLIVIIKGQQIVDIFMELKHAPKLWRSLMLSYVVLLPTIIAAIYLIF